MKLTIFALLLIVATNCRPPMGGQPSMNTMGSGAEKMKENHSTDEEAKRKKPTDSEEKEKDKEKKLNKKGEAEESKRVESDREKVKPLENESKDKSNKSSSKSEKTPATRMTKKDFYAYTGPVVKGPFGVLKRPVSYYVGYYGWGWAGYPWWPYFRWGWISALPLYPWSYIESNRLFCYKGCEDLSLGCDEFKVDSDDNGFLRCTCKDKENKVEVVKKYCWSPRECFNSKEDKCIEVKTKIEEEKSKLKKEDDKEKEKEKDRRKALLK
jgi:DNA mismatch repair ATPase MutL